MFNKIVLFQLIKNHCWQKQIRKERNEIIIY